MVIEELIELGRTVGPTAVVAVVAFYAIVETMKLKRNGSNGDNRNIMKEIKNLGGNHLGEVNTKLDRLDDKDDRIIELLIEIKAILKSK